MSGGAVGIEGVGGRAPRLRTEAWLVRGLSAIPGELVLDRDGIAFLATGPGSAGPRALRTLERQLRSPWRVADAGHGHAGAQLFHWPLRRVSVQVPWYYFSGGLKLGHGGVVLRFSFGRPGNMELARDLASAWDALRTVHAMRRCGKAWLHALERARSAAGDEATGSRRVRLRASR